MKSKTTQTSLVLTIILLAFVSLLPLVVASPYTRFLGDDSYITLTFVKNLVRGNGFVFNHGPAVLGTTTPLFTLVVAGLALIFSQIDIPVIAVFLTAFCWIGIVWTIFFFRKEWGMENWHVCILALVLMASGWIEILGMEAYPFAFLLVLSLSLYFSKHYYLSGFGIGLLFLTRGEGILVLAVLLVTMLMEQWFTRKSVDIELVRIGSKIFVGFMLPVSLWAIYAHFTFGSFLPNTLAAKQAQGKTGLWNPFLYRLIFEWMPLWGKSFTFKRLPFINFWWVIILIGIIDVFLKKHRWLIFVWWISFYILGYTFLNVAAYWWYQLPVLFVLNLFFGLGVIRIVEMLIHHITLRNISLSMSVIFIFIVAFILAKQTIANFTLANHQMSADGKSFMALSRWFRTHTNSSESIAYMEVGYLGYYTDNRIIDLAGLVMPEACSHIGNGDFSWSFWHYKPDYYIYQPDFDKWALASIKADPRFDQQYLPVRNLPGTIDSEFIIYKRIAH